SASGVDAVRGPRDGPASDGARAAGRRGARRAREPSGGDCARAARADRRARHRPRVGAGRRRLHADPTGAALRRGDPGQRLPAERRESERSRMRPRRGSWAGLCAAVLMVCAGCAAPDPAPTPTTTFAPPTATGTPTPTAAAGLWAPTGDISILATG